VSPTIKISLRRNNPSEQIFQCLLSPRQDNRYYNHYVKCAWCWDLFPICYWDTVSIL